MTETEKIFQEAIKIARAAFATPSESAVMDLFQELCAERDRAPNAPEDYPSVTVH